MSVRPRTVRRCVTATVVIVAVGVAGAGTSSADHIHSKEVGNERCVLLAQHGGESEVDLPFATPAQVAANRAHPLHLLVHLGRPGSNFAIGVAGTASDPCGTTGSYVND